MIMEDMKGGLATDGVSVDPVSGNDVPLGSNAKDVRDDVEASLSSGEYVVPADVVKYFGVAHFEKLRDKAKMGLEGMGAEGRIGGQEMGEVVDMADGGIVDRKISAAEVDAGNAEMRKSVGLTPQGYAEGGAVPAAASFDPYAHTPGFSQQGAAPAAAVAAPVCPEGYVWDPELGVCSPVAVEATAPPQGGGGRSSRPTSPSRAPASSSNTWMEKFDYSDADTLFEQSMDKVGRASEEVDEEGGFLSKLGDGLLSGLSRTLAGGVLGKFMATTNSAQIAANALALRSMGREDLAAQLETQNKAYVKENGIDLVPGTWRDGDKLFENIEQEKGSFSERVKTAPGTNTASTANNTPSTTTNTPSGDSADRVYKEAESSGDLTASVNTGGVGYNTATETRDDGGTTTVSRATGSTAPKTTAVKPQARPEAPKKETFEEKASRGGGYNKGGYVSKRTPKKAPAKTKGGLGRKPTK